MKPKIHIASCSFGKDSIATILLALENNEPLDRVVFSEVMFYISRKIIRVANCDDGYRAVCNYKFKGCLNQMPVTQFIEPVSTEREAIASAIEERLKNIINRSGVKENKEIVYLLHKLLQEYNQLDLFEDETN